MTFTLQAASFLGLQLIVTLVFISPCVSGAYSPNDNCRFTLVESIPDNVTYPSGTLIGLSTHAAHKRLMSLAEKEIDISSFYWTLQGSDLAYHDNSAWEGEDIFKSLQGIIKAKKVAVKIAENENRPSLSSNDTKILAQAGAQVRTLNFDRLMNGGILHTKMWIVDNKHMYVGSANFDWRSYTQVKETGILIEDCSVLVSDVSKIFQVYWYLGQPDVTVPKTWPSSLSTNINATRPLPIYYNGTSDGLVYISSSPPAFCPSGRTSDIDAILNVIYSAREFVYISVMDYLPVIMYQRPRRFWPIIDDALRKVAYEKKVKVYLMAGCWSHSMPDMFDFLKTLNDLHKVSYVDVQVKYFTVPVKTDSQGKIPFARVNHSKFMVTDQHAYIGTSNWSGSYFIDTGGVGFVLQQAKGTNSSGNSANFRQQLEDVFLRDWNSSDADVYCKK